MHLLQCGLARWDFMRSAAFALNIIQWKYRHIAISLFLNFRNIAFILQKNVMETHLEIEFQRKQRQTCNTASFCHQAGKPPVHPQKVNSIISTILFMSLSLTTPIIYWCSIWMISHIISMQTSFIRVKI